MTDAGPNLLSRRPSGFCDHIPNCRLGNIREEWVLYRNAADFATVVDDKRPGQRTRKHRLLFWTVQCLDHGIGKLAFQSLSEGRDPVVGIALAGHESKVAGGRPVLQRFGAARIFKLTHYPCPGDIDKGEPVQY